MGGMFSPLAGDMLMKDRSSKGRGEIRDLVCTHFFKLRAQLWRLNTVSSVGKFLAREEHSSCTTHFVWYEDKWFLLCFRRERYNTGGGSVYTSIVTFFPPAERRGKKKVCRTFSGAGRGICHPWFHPLGACLMLTLIHFMCFSFSCLLCCLDCFQGILNSGSFPLSVLAREKWKMRNEMKWK